MNTNQDNHQTPDKSLNLTTVSNITGGITDEEFADEFLKNPTVPDANRARYQFNFLGADLEKINSAKNVKEELKNYLR